jgi:hypothetical protein
MPTISAANAVKGVGGFVKSVAYQEDEIASIPYKCRLNSGQSKRLPPFRWCAHESFANRLCLFVSCALFVNFRLENRILGDIKVNTR